MAGGHPDSAPDPVFFCSNLTPDEIRTAATGWAQMRANLLRERLGLKAVSFRISTGPLRTRQVVAPGRPPIAELIRAVRLMPQFSRGIRNEAFAKDQRFPFEKRIQDWMAKRGIGRMLGFVVNPQDGFERRQPQGPFERQVRALHQALSAG